MAVNLIFSEAASTGSAHAVDLVFGADSGSSAGTTAVIAVDLSAPPAVAIVGGTGIPYSVAIDLNDAPTVAISATYDPAVYRGPRRSVSAPWQPPAPVGLRVESPWPAAVTRAVAFDAPIADATPLPDAERTTRWGESVVSRQQVAARWDGAAQLRADETQVVSRQAQATRQRRSTAWQEGRELRPASTSLRYQETDRRQRRTIRARHEEAKPIRRTISSTAHDASGLVRSWVVPWQQAAHPAPGHSVIVPPVTPPDLCYTPPAASDVPLVFTTQWDGSTELTFTCDNHPVTPPGSTVVVPIQEVYMVSNDVSLVLASDGTAIPTRGFSLSLDYTSWSWSFSARVPRAALPLFDMDAGGDPKVLTATVNGTAFSIVAESVASDRGFNTGDVTITGRGIIAGLADPYAPTLTFGNTEARTAQQLVADVLMDNGVSLGWAVDWQLTDWLVPAGAWSFQGTYMAAVQAIAAAAGGYVQPTANDQTVRILPLFPTAPWTWGDMVPDYSLPASVVSREGITWSDLPAYNRIFVSGTTASGVLGDVKRAGSAGDFEKPMVTDQLITHADAARQRGIAELGVGGRSALVSLQLPVLPAVGVILPGKTVAYVDGDTTRKGIVRSVAVEAGFPTVYQTIGVETHV